MNDEKLIAAAGLLNSAWEEYQADPANPLRQAALAKAFEVTFEYVWKFFKREADEAGLEVYSPRDALKAAARLHLISDLNLWNDFLNARNLSVHDYVRMEDADFTEIIGKFKDEMARLLA
jgi:nucleotidyltransferase substrate binding protein (TIGR01987 family)